MRHGQTVWNQSNRLQGQRNSPLTETGIQQAYLLKEKLRNKCICCAYSSTLERASNTASIIIQDSDIPLYYRSELNEISLGKWEGKTQIEAEKLNPEQYNNFWNAPEKYLPSSGETYFDLQARSVSLIYEMMTENKGKNVLVVSHGITIKVILCHFKNMRIDEIRKLPLTENGSHILIKRTGYDIIVL